MHVEAGDTYEDGLGGSITILEPGDETAPLRYVMRLPPGFGPPVAEDHPDQREEFLVRRGQLDLGMIDGRHVVLREGERFTLPPGIEHLPRAVGDEAVEFEATLAPGLTAAAMFASIYTETRTRSGLDRFAHVAMTFRRHREVIRFPQPVRTVMMVVAGVARLLGARPTETVDVPG